MQQRYEPSHRPLSCLRAYTQGFSLTTRFWRKDLTEPVQRRFVTLNSALIKSCEDVARGYYPRLGVDGRGDPRRPSRTDQLPCCRCVFFCRSVPCCCQRPTVEIYVSYFLETPGSWPRVRSQRLSNPHDREAVGVGPRWESPD